MLVRLLLLAELICGVLTAQRAEIRPAAPTSIPSVVDSNIPAYWSDGQFRVLTSDGLPERLSGADQFSFTDASPVALSGGFPTPVWFESVWSNDEGVLFLWYHHEDTTACPGGSLTLPKIGAAISFDGGASVTDLGFVLTSGDPADCGAQNGYFAGGHGDFSVIFDAATGYFYFLFTNYGGDGSKQGVSVARMAFEDRFQPVGAVQKWDGAGWSSSGLDGPVTPVFAATVPWQEAAADSLWGPSIHWNQSLGQYVVLLNHSCCAPGWPQDGIYVSYAADLSDPSSWKSPERLMDSGDWYPAVLGLGPGDTSSFVTGPARLYIHGYSEWEIEFSPE